MANVNLGKVALTPAGNYSSTSTYDKLDIVNYQGSSFVAKKAVPVGYTTGINEYWQEIASIGATGPTGPQGPIGHTIEWGEIVGNIEDQQDLNTSLSTLNASLSTLEDTKEDLIIKSASGSIVSFDDGTDYSLAELKVNIEPQQDLNGYDNPWPAGGGKNLCHITSFSTTVNGVSISAVDNVLILNNTSTSQIAANNSVWKNVVFKITTEGIYTRSITNTLQSNMNIASFSMNDNTMYGSVSTTYPVGDYYIGLYIPSGITFNNYKISFQIEAGSSATSYTPYSNICPISGFSQAVVTRTGKNLLNVIDATVGSLSWSVDSDGYVTSSNTTTDGRGWTYANCQWFVYLKAGTYKIIGEAKTVSTPSSSLLSLRDSNNKEIRGALNLNNNSQISGEFTLTKDQSIGILAKIFDGSWRFAIRLASDTSNAYEPYQGTSVTIDLNGTRYGGTIDVLAGTMRVDREIITKNGSQNYGNPTVQSNGFYTFIIAIGENGQPHDIPIICNQSKGISYDNRGYAEECCFVGGTNLFFNTKIATTSTELKAYLTETPLIFTCYLAQPITIQLSPSTLSTLLGDNNIWASTGSIQSLKYWTLPSKDLTTALDVRLNETVREQQQLITNIEPDMKASTNYTAGELVIVDNKLLRVTSTITTGSSFTIGTNVEQVNLETVINEKASQTSVSTALATKAPLASPALTGTPTAPTPTSGDDSTKIATTAFVQDVAENKQDIPIHSTSGVIASFEDGADNLPVSALNVAIEPVQDLHGYSSPWPAGGGKNLYDEETYPLTDGYWINSTSGNIEESSNYSYTPSYIPCGNLAGETLTMNKRPGGNFPGIAFYTAKNVSSFISGIANGGNTGAWTFTVPATAQYMRFTQASGATKVQIEKGSSSTTWAPYSNICPISGWTEAVVTRCGINLWDEDWEKGGIDSTTGENVNSQQIRSKGYIRVVPGMKLYGVGDQNSGSSNFITRWYDKYKNYLGSNPFFYTSSEVTVPANAYYLRFCMQSSYGLTYNNDVSINYPLTDHDYHAHNFQSVTIALGSTVYGGSIDVLTGTMTVDMGIRDLSTLTDWNYNGTRFIASIPGLTLENTRLKGICSNYPIFNGTVADAPDKSCIFGAQGTTSIYVKDSAYDDVTTFTNAMSGVQVCYKLETPLTVNLTPAVLSTLLGQNNIWADTGDILNIEYWGQNAQDLGNAIERRIQASQRATRSIIAGIETEMVASKNYSSGDLLIVGNDLLKATSSITSTSTLVIGTNVAKTTVAEQLIALAS